MPPKKGAAAKQNGPMAAAGAAKPTQDSRANQLTIANACLQWLPDPELKAQAGDDWTKIPEAIICAYLIWRFLATYLSEVHEIAAGKRNAGKHLKNVEAIWSGLFHESSVRISAGSSDESKVRAPAALWDRPVLNPQSLPWASH